MAQSIGDDTSVDIKALEKTIRGHLKGDSSLPVTSCIFRVPEVLRRNDTKAYQPDMVAIGPLHDRKQNQYQHMEKVKQWYLSEYILKEKNVDLAKLIEVVARDETHARDCYAESLSIKPNEFIENMILDGCFIVELFRRFTSKERKNEFEDGSQPMKADPIHSMDCMFRYICHDILLLENQLPWFVLQNLYSHTMVDHDTDYTLSELILEVFTFLPSVGNNCEAYRLYLCTSPSDANHKHVLDLIRTSIVHSFKALVPSDDAETRCLLKVTVDEEDIGREIHPATTLSKGGVKFKRKPHDGAISIMSMEFVNGELRIPQLVIEELTEPLFRNLIAFEQCYRSHSPKITSYSILMERLISSKEDMEFLCEKKIIRNWLSAQDGFEFFNKLCKDTTINKFCYDEICTKVNRYYNIKCVKWMEILWREYFQTPWTTISLFAATILLLLTLVQTIFTVHK